jgi:putative peptidoglycan lipid II flippase
VTIIEPGLRLTNRYRVEELLLDEHGVRSWRAVDEILGRSVLVQSLPVDDPRTPQLMMAARAAALVNDARFLRVLDVGTHGDMGYLIREWLHGVNLTTILIAEGALAPARAGTVARHVAEALANAHDEGLSHLVLTPDSVILGLDGSVKVTGLATEAVVKGITTTDPGRMDARGVGRILYAALTGRWPNGPVRGLRPAPLVDGHLPSPRQVRAGVPRVLDEVADRILGDPPRKDVPPLTNPAEVAAALAASLPGSRMAAVTGTGPAPALIDVERPTSIEPVQSHTMVQTRAPEPLRGRSQTRLLGVVAGTLLIVGGALFGLQLLLQGVSEQNSDGASPAPGESLAALPITSAHDYDPAGNGSESPRNVAYAFDADPSTAWTTQEYYDPLEVQKAGVGLVLDAGEVTEVAGAQLSFFTGGSDVEVLVAPDTNDIPEAVDGWQTAASRQGADKDLRVVFDAPARTRYVLVWFTRLPQAGGVWEDGIAEASLLAP